MVIVSSKQILSFVLFLKFSFYPKRSLLATKRRGKEEDAKVIGSAVVRVHLFLPCVQESRPPLLFGLVTAADVRRQACLERHVVRQPCSSPAYCSLVP